MWALCLLLLLLALAEGATQPYTTATSQKMPPLESCKPFEVLESWEILGFRNLNQLRQSRRRREFELTAYIQFKRNPTDDERQRAMWTSSRTLEDLETEFNAVANVTRQLEARIDAMWAQIRAKANLPDKRHYIEHIHCFMGRLRTELFPFRPRISIMVQFWKRQDQMVEKLVRSVERCSKQVPLELVVNVDNPVQHDLWLDWAYNRTQGLVVPVFSQNVHEKRAYNRLAQLARAPIVVAAQDDMAFPEDCSWTEQVIDTFNKHPDLGAIGHRGWCDNLGRERVCASKRTFFKEPQLGFDFQFVGAVDLAPVSFRRAALLDVGGFDEGMSEPGQCGILSDWEISSRLWMAGWKVGYIPLEMYRDIEPGGTHHGSSQHRCWSRQQHLTDKSFQMRFTLSALGEILGLVQKANLGLALKDTDNKCPYLPQFCQRLPYRFEIPPPSSPHTH